MINSKNYKQGFSEKSSDRPVEESVNLSNNFSAGIRPNLLSSQVNQPGPAKPASTFENTGVNIESVVQNRKFSSRIIGLLTVAVMLLLAIIFLFLAYNLYRTSYNNIQKSRVATNYDTTSVDLGTGITSGSQGIGILQVNGDANITNNVTANSFSGGGADLTNLNADNITSGTLNDARLSANVALLDANQTFTGNNTFAGANIYTGSSNFTGPVSLPGTLVINSLSYSTPSAQANGVLTNDGSGNLVWQAVGPCPTCINNGGDSFGAAISIGTNDNNNLIFKTNNTTRLTFNTTGDATFTGAIYGDGTQLTGVAKLALNNQTFTGNNQVFQNTANSTTAFEVKNSGAVSVLTADTQNGKVIAPTIQANTITPTSAMTVGSTSQTLTLNGGSSSSWVINGTGFSTTVGFNGVPTDNVMYYFDRTAAAGNYAVCTSAGNCGGGGGITGGGTAGTIAKFTGPSGVGDSLLSESGSQITVNGTLKVLSASPDYMTLNSFGLAIYDDSAGTTTNYLFPAAGNNTYDVCTSSGNCFGAGGSGANTALSNLDSATIAINTSLLPGPIGPINLGSNTKPFGELFIYGTSATPATQNFKLTGSATGARTITFPDYTGTVCTTDGTTAQVCAGYANNTLSNLGTVALNSVLQPATAGALSLGVSTLPFSDLYLSGSSATPATNRFRITGTSSGGLRTITFPDENGTVCTTGSVCSGYAPSTGGSGYVQLQATTPGTQQSGNLNLSGTGIFGSAVSLGTASAANGTIVIKNSTTAFDLTLNAPNTTTSNKTITFPNENGTVCTTGSVCSGYAPSSGSTSYFAQGGNGFGGTAYLGTTDANALVLRTGVGTNAAQTRFTIDAAASNLTGNGATTYSGTGAITLQSSSAASNVNIATNTTSGAITIGGGATGGGLITIGGVSGLGAGDNATINIGYGNAIQIVTSGIPFAGIYNSSVTIGNSTGITTVKALSTLVLDGTAINTNINIGDTLTTGTINFGQNITTGSINIGTSQTSGTITIGGIGGGTTGDVKIGDGAGSGVVSIGNPNATKTINIGTASGGVKTITLGGISANVIKIGDTQTAGSIAMGTAMTTGTISIGGTGAQTGTIDIAPGTGVQAVNIGTGGTGAKTITFGNTGVASTFAFNSGATTSAAMTLTTNSITNGTGMQINANALTTGTGLGITSTSTGLTGNALSVTTSSTSAPTNGLVRFNFNGIRTAAGNAFQIDDVSTTLATTMRINSNSLTTGTGIALSTNSITSGTGLSVASSTTGLTGDLVKFETTGSNAGITGNALKVGITGATGTGTAVNITNAGTGLSFRVNDDGTYTDSTPMVVDANGNAGIGTATPGAKLEVAGSIIATGSSGFISSPYSIVSPMSQYQQGSVSTMTSIGTTATGTLPSSVATDPTGRFVYVTNQSSSTVQAYTINQSTGALTSVGTTATGSQPVNMTTDPTGRFAYLVNVAGNTVQAYTINQSTGALTSVGTTTGTVQASNVVLEPTGRFAFILENGSTAYTYSINQSTGALTQSSSVSTFGSSGPAGVADPTGRFLFYTQFTSSTLATYRIDQTTGALTSASTVTAAGTASTSKLVAADPSGRFLYVTNQSSNTVEAFIINQSTGALTSLGTTATGTSPRGLAVDPSGRFVYVTNNGGNSVQAYSINQSTGALTSVGTVATGASPRGPAIDPTGRFVYIPNSTDNNVQAFTSLGSLAGANATFTGTVGVSSPLVTGTAMSLDANALTSGNGLAITSTSTTMTGNALSVTTSTTSAPTNGLVRYNFSGVRTTAGNAFQIDDASTTLATAMKINVNSLTTGKGLEIASTGTGLTTGNMFSVSSATTGDTSTGIINFSFSGVRTTGTSLGMYIRDLSTTAGGTEVTDGTGQFVAGSALTINAIPLTSGVSMAIANKDLTTGALLYLRKDGGSNTTTSAGSLLRVAASDFVTNFQGNVAHFYMADSDSATNTGNILLLETANMTTNSLMRLLQITTSQTTNKSGGYVNFSFTGARTAGNGFQIDDNNNGTTAANSVVINQNSTTRTTGKPLVLSATGTNTDMISLQDSTNTCTGNPGATFAWTCTSDQSYKENITDSPSILSGLTALQIRAFDWKSGAGHEDYGVVAQEVETTSLNWLVKTDPETGIKSVTTPSEYMLIKGLQEVNTKVDTMQSGLSTSVLQIIADAGAITINGTLTINGITIFNGEVQFNSDTAGTATIPAGQTSISVTFTKPMSKVPRVTATPQGVIDGSVGVTAKSVNGFTIQLQNAQASDIDIDWQALVSQ